MHSLTQAQSSAADALAKTAQYVVDVGLFSHCEYFHLVRPGADGAHQLHYTAFMFTDNNETYDALRPHSAPLPAGRLAERASQAEPTHLQFTSIDVRDFGRLNGDQIVALESFAGAANMAVRAGLFRCAESISGDSPPFPFPFKLQSKPSTLVMAFTYDLASASLMRLAFAYAPQNPVRALLHLLRANAARSDVGAVAHAG